MRKLVYLFVVIVAACGQPQKGEPGSPGTAGTNGTNGQSGEAGATGLRGNTGPAGATGPAAGVVSSLFCTKVVGFLFQYDASALGDGALFVSCSISSNTNESTGSFFWMAGTVGASDGGCTVTFDVDTPSSGFWSFGLSPLQAQYHDVGSADDGQTVTFSPTGDCSGH